MNKLITAEFTEPAARGSDPDISPEIFSEATHMICLEPFFLSKMGKLFSIKPKCATIVPKAERGRPRARVSAARDFGP